MTEADSKHYIGTLVERLRQARQWGWYVHDHRVPGVARDLAWALIGMTRDHDPDTYKGCPRVDALNPQRLGDVLDLAAGIAGLIAEADQLQPHLIRDKGVGQ